MKGKAVMEELRKKGHGNAIRPLTDGMNTHRYNVQTVHGSSADGMNTHRYNVQTIHGSSADGINTHRYNVQTIHGSSIFDF